MPKRDITGAVIDRPERNKWVDDGIDPRTGLKAYPKLHPVKNEYDFESLTAAQKFQEKMNSPFPENPNDRYVIVASGSVWSCRRYGDFPVGAIK